MNSAAQTKGTTQYFIEITDILNDIVVLRNNSCAMIIETTAVNFGLLSTEEQQATIVGFAALLNSLSFSIQIVIHSKRLDLSSYIKNLENTTKAQGNPLLRIQAAQYRSFVERLMKNSSIIDKAFYIVIPFSPLEAGLSFKKIDKKMLVEKAKSILYPKKDQILSLLSGMGIKGTVLNNGVLVFLFYNIYSPRRLGQMEFFQKNQGL